MKAFRDARVYLEGVGIRTCTLTFDTHTRGIDTPEEDAEWISLPPDCTVVPGFIDTHIHGAGGADTMDATTDALATMAATLGAEGTTAFLATTMTQSKEATRRALSAAATYCHSNSPLGARCLGVHMEGPFLSQVYAGAQPKEYMIDPSCDLFDALTADTPDIVRVVTVAPERPGAQEFISHLTSRGIVVSVGHSDAGEADIRRAMDAGLSAVTHTYNAQRPLHHREIGVVGSALLYDNLRCELIADKIHVSPAAMRLLVRTKGVDNITLITDAMREKGMPDGISELGGQTVYVKNGEARLADGTLAGSVARMNEMVKNLVEVAGVSLTDAVDCASLHPARALHIDHERGGIRIGKCADYTVFSPAMRVIMTIRDGNIIYRAD